jgi:DivIVA domain-containing protein
VTDARFQDLIERIQNAKFRTTRLSPGYDDEEVDNLALARLRPPATARTPRSALSSHALAHLGARVVPCGAM